MAPASSPRSRLPPTDVARSKREPANAPNKANVIDMWWYMNGVSPASAVTTTMVTTVPTTAAEGAAMSSSKKYRTKAPAVLISTPTSHAAANRGPKIAPSQLRIMGMPGGAWY